MGWALAIALASIGTASAADCDRPYALDSLADDLATIEAALLQGDPAAAAMATALEGELACLDAVLPRVVVGRAYRAVVAGNLSVDPAAPVDWLRTAAAVDRGFQYSLEELPDEAHPAFEAWRVALEQGVDVKAEPVVGKAWAEGVYHLDGRRMRAPAAEPGMPHLLQRTAGGAVTTWRVDGAAIPAELLVVDTSTPASGVTTAVVPAQGKTTMKVSQAKQYNWPTERVALVGGGAAALVGGGVLYGLAWDRRGRFDDSSTRADTERLARSTNTLTVASTATLAAGAGTLGFGVLFFIVDGDPRPTLDLRF